MTSGTDNKTGKKSDNKKKEHLNDLLDEGLEETFPASDTPAVTIPGQADPAGPDDDTRKKKKKKR